MSDQRLKELFHALTPNETHKDKLFQTIAAKAEAEPSAGSGAFGSMDSGSPATRMHTRHSRRASERTTRSGAPRGWIKPALLSAIAVFCLAATTAYAAAYMGLELKLLNFLNPAGREQAQYLENGAYVVGQQVSNENGTLEVKQIIGDGNMVYILMDFTAPEGTVLGAERYRFQHPDLSYERTTPYSAGYDFKLLDDENKQDNRISLVMAYTTDQLTQGQMTKLRLSDLQGAGPFPDKFQVEVPGTWETSFMMDYLNMSAVYTPEAKLSLYGYEATLASLSISPISVKLRLESPFVQNITDAARLAEQEIGPNLYSDSYPLTLHYEDGTTEETTEFTGSVTGDLLDNSLTIIKTFTPVISDKKIQSVGFFGAVIPVNDSQRTGGMPDH